MNGHTMNPSDLYDEVYRVEAEANGKSLEEKIDLYKIHFPISPKRHDAIQLLLLNLAARCILLEQAVLDHCQTKELS